MVFYGKGDDWTSICFYDNTTQSPLSVSLVASKQSVTCVASIPQQYARAEALHQYQNSMQELKQKTQRNMACHTTFCILSSRHGGKGGTAEAQEAANFCCLQTGVCMPAKTVPKLQQCATYLDGEWHSWGG